jgi:hypothetical protein
MPCAGISRSRRSATDHGDRELYGRIVELYLKIGRELEVISDRKKTRTGTNVPA